MKLKELFKNNLLARYGLTKLKNIPFRPKYISVFEPMKFISLLAGISTPMLIIKTAPRNELIINGRKSP